MHHRAVCGKTAGRKNDAVLCRKGKLVAVSVGAHDAGNSVAVFDERFARRLYHDRDIVHLRDVFDIGRNKAGSHLHHAGVRALPQRTRSLADDVGKAHAQIVDPTKPVVCVIAQYFDEI